MKKLMMVLAAAFAAAVWADAVSLTDAVTAAENWIASGETMGVNLSPQVVGAQTFTDGDGSAHVIALDGGGFVVTSTDDEVEPILAFSASGTFTMEVGSPLAALLGADVRARKSTTEQNNQGGKLRLMSVAAFSVGASDEENANRSKWNRLLGRNAGHGLRLMASSGLSNVDTTCVAPLIQSKWDQKSIGLFNDNCYNYYTPHGYPCGCVATAMAQVMRYYQYPTESVTPKEVKCSVDDVSTNLMMKGGYYDWANMPLDPSSANAAQRKAIGKLTYDCGVAVGMDYKSAGSSASMLDACNALQEIFDYTSASMMNNPPMGDTFHSIAQNNLNVARPILLAIKESGKSVGHAIVADGYGYSDSTCYYHLNMGWSGEDDLWYNLPDVREYNIISAVIYDIKPSSNWQKTDMVTLDWQGGSGGTASVTATYGSAMPLIVAPTRLGYTFGGYYTSTGGSGTQYYTTDGTSARIWDKTSATTLYAKWTALYPVTYEPGAYGTGYQHTDTKTQNVTLYLKGALFTRTGYAQTGWATSDGGAKKYDLCGSYTANDSVTLYPYWTENAISLATALDNDSLTFSTGGDACWYGQTNTTHDSVDAARSEAIGDGKSTWMRTFVEGCGEISFWWKCDTGNNWVLKWHDTVDFIVDGVRVSRIYDTKDWRKVTTVLTENKTHVIEWLYTKDSHVAWEDRADCAWVDQVVWKPMVKVTLDAQGGSVASNELFVARNVLAYYGSEVLPTPTWVNRRFLGWYSEPVGGTRVSTSSWWLTPSQDTTFYAHWEEYRYLLWDDDVLRNASASMSDYYTGGDAQWMKVASPAKDGVYSFQSGAIEHGQATWMEKEVSGPGRVTFYWRPSSEMNCDVCTFTVNGVEKGRISGVSDGWSYESYTIDEIGSHTLRWTYFKDISVAKGSDCVWVDGIIWQPQISVTLDGNGGTIYGWTSRDVTKYVGDGFSYLPSPTRTGYRFDGWFTRSNGGVRVDSNTTVSSDLSVLYAHWLKEESLADVFGTALPITTGGASTWFGQSAVSCDGGSAACSGRLSYGQSNWMELAVTGAGRLRFAWAIDGDTTYSTAAYSDSLTFLTNGIETAKIIGRQDWTNCAFTVGGGAHTFRWSYTKKGFSSAGADCAWVDDVVWEPEEWVFFEPRGGSLSKDWYRGYVGDEVLLPTPIRDGYTFEGWFTEEEGGEKIDGMSFVLDRTRWLYAHWSFSGVSADVYRNESIYLTWPLSPEATLYSIYRSTTAGWADAEWLSDRTSRWYFDYTAIPGVDYWYRVVAVDADGNRAQSNVVKGRLEVDLSLSTSEMHHDALAGSEKVDVRANTSWRAVSSATWLKLTAASGAGSGLLSYTVTHNFSQKARTGTITVTAGDGVAYPKTLTICVSQSGWGDSVGGYWFGGVVDTAFGKAQTVLGALFKDGELVGTVLLKFGRVNKKKGTVKVSASATLLIGGKTKKIRAKTVTMTLDDDGALRTSRTATLAFKAPIGAMVFELVSDGTFTLKGNGYEMVGATRAENSETVQRMVVGGTLSRGTLLFNVEMDTPPNFGKGLELVEEALPVDVPVTVSGTKWEVGKARALKYRKVKENGTVRYVLSMPGGNVSGLKLKYAAKTGMFTGSFRLYATIHGAKPKLKKRTATVVGLVMDGVGRGEARCKNPASGPWVVTVE